MAIRKCAKEDEEGCGYGNGSRIFLADVGQGWGKEEEEGEEKEVLQVFATVLFATRMQIFELTEL